MIITHYPYNSLGAYMKRLKSVRLRLGRAVHTSPNLGPLRDDREAVRGGPGPCAAHVDGLVPGRQQPVAPTLGLRGVQQADLRTTWRTMHGVGRHCVDGRIIKDRKEIYSGSWNEHKSYNS